MLKETMWWDTVSTFLPLKHSFKYCKNKHTKTQTNKQIDRSLLLQKHHISSIYCSQNASTDIFQDIAYQLWQWLQHWSLGISDCTEQINSLSRSWGAIQGKFLVHLYCNPAHQIGTAVLKTSQTTFIFCFPSELLSQKMNLDIYLVCF